MFSGGEMFWGQISHRRQSTDESHELADQEDELFQFVLVQVGDSAERHP
jgi:hypothetical protein